MLVSTWANKSICKSEEHNKRAKANKVLSSCFGLPSLLLPVTFATITPLIDTLPSHMFIQVGSYVAIAFFSGVNTYYNFDKRATKHEHYAARYIDLANDIRYQLYKSRRFRVPSDEFLARIQAKLSNLNEREPS